MCIFRKRTLENALFSLTCFNTNRLISDPAVRAVAVTFVPGVRRVVPVEHGAYLAVIAPAMRTILVDIEALDEHGAVLYHTTYP